MEGSVSMNASKWSNSLFTAMRSAWNRPVHGVFCECFSCASTLFIQLARSIVDSNEWYCLRFTMALVTRLQVRSDSPEYAMKIDRRLPLSSELIRAEAVTPCVWS